MAGRLPASSRMTGKVRSSTLHCLPLHDAGNYLKGSLIRLILAHGTLFLEPSSLHSAISCTCELLSRCHVHDLTSLLPCPGAAQWAHQQSVVWHSCLCDTGQPPPPCGMLNLQSASCMRFDKDCLLRWLLVNMQLGPVQAVQDAHPLRQSLVIAAAFLAECDSTCLDVLYISNTLKY